MILATNAPSMVEPQKIQPTLFFSLDPMSDYLVDQSLPHKITYNYILLNVYYVPIPLLRAPAALWHCISSSQYPYEVDSIVIPIRHIRDMRF